MASWPRDPWLRPEPGSQEAALTVPSCRPEALLVEAGRIRDEVQPHVKRALHEVQPGRGRGAHEVQPGREGAGRQAHCVAGRIRDEVQPGTRDARCQAHHRLEGITCRLSIDSHVQGRRTSRPGHRTCAAAAWLWLGKVRPLDTCAQPGLITRCQVVCTETKARGEGTCATSARPGEGKDHVSDVYDAEAHLESPRGRRRHVRKMCTSPRLSE